MSRAIIVLALPRTGSSAVAGVLHRLGVWMGDELQPADELNERGYYEDRHWQKINKQVMGLRYPVRFPTEIGSAVIEQYRRAIRHYDARYPLWGFKDPRTCFTFRFIALLLNEAGIETQIVSVVRDFDDSLASLHRHSKIAYAGEERMTKKAARKLLGTWQQAHTEALQGFEGPVLEVSYEGLMEDAPKEIFQLMDFCFTGLADDLWPTEEKVQAAMEFLGI